MVAGKLDRFSNQKKKNKQNQLLRTSEMENFASAE